jgi:hypothetical protein
MEELVRTQEDRVAIRPKATRADLRVFFMFARRARGYPQEAANCACK